MTPQSTAEPLHRCLTTFRLLEGVALTGSLAAVLTTYLLLGVHATELNPLSAVLIDHVGIEAVGLARIAVVVAAFAALNGPIRRWRPRFAVGLAGGTALLYLANGANDLLVLSRTGLPESFFVGEAMAFGALVCGVAVVGFGRREVVSVGRRARPVVSTHAPSSRSVGAVVFAVLLVGAIIGPFASLGGLAGKHDGIVNAAAGDEDWSTTVNSGGAVDAVGSNENNGVVYAGGNDDSVHEINPDGTLGWEYTAPSGGQVSEIVVDDSTGDIYAIGSDTPVHAINPDGTQKWTYSVGSFTGGIAVDEQRNTVYYTDNDNTAAMIYALNATDGSVKWSGPADTRGARVVVNQADGTVYVAHGDTNEIVAFDPNGTEVDRSSTTKGAVKDMSINQETGEVYVATGNNLVASYSPDLTYKWEYTGYGTTVASLDVNQDTGYIHTVDFNTEYHILNKSGGAVNVRIDFNYRSNAVDVNEGDKRVYHADENGDVKALQTYEPPGHPISGTVTDHAGNPVENEPVETGTGASTTTGADGSFELTVEETGSYQVTAGGDSYAEETQTVDVPDGGTTGVDFDLRFVGDFAGQVRACEITDPRCSDSSPVGNATVEVWGVNHSNVTQQFDDVTSSAEAEQKAEEIMTEIQTLEPDSWDSDKQLLGEQGTFETTSDPYVAAHTTGDWAQGGWTDTPDLRPPLLKLPANQEVAFSAWDPDEGGIQDGVEDQLPGAPMNNEEIVIRQLGPDGETTNSKTLQLDPEKQGYAVGGLGLEETHAYRTTTLAPGFYEVSVKDSSTSYVVMVGDNPFAGVVSDLENERGELLDQSQEIEDYLDQGVLQRQNVRADEQGRFAVEFENTRVETVGAFAYKADRQLDPTASESMLKQVEDLRIREYNGSVYMPREPVNRDVPASGVTIRTTELSSAPFANFSNLSAQARAQLQEFFDAPLDTIREDLWGLPGSEFDEEFVNDRYNETRDRTEDLFGDNPEDAYPEEPPDWMDENPDWDEQPPPENNDEVIERIADLEEALEEQRDDDLAEEPDTEIGNGNFSGIFPFAGDVDPETVSVMLELNDGTVQSVDEEHWTVEQTMNPLEGDRVVIEEYPLPDGTAVADVHVDAVVDEESVATGRSSAINPSYSGDVPALNAVDASTSRPGPDETVTLRLRPEAGTGYGSLVQAEAFGPEGEVSMTVNETEDTASFSTNGPGAYTARLTYEARDGGQFTQRVQLNAGNQSASLPPTVTAANGPGGKPIAIAGEGLRNAKIESDETLDRTTVTAEIPGDGTIDQLHVKAGAVTKTEHTQIRVVQGSEQRAYQNHIRLVVHSQLTEDALVWRDEDPITRAGETRYGEIAERENGDKHLIRSYTNSRGMATLRVVQDPSIVDRAGHRVGVFIAGLPNPSLPFSITPAFDIGALSAPLQVGGSPLAVLGSGVAAARRGQS